MKLYLARHAQCIKNLAGIPGGEGTALTALGITEAHDLARRVGLNSSQPKRVVACPPTQTQQTAEIVADSLGLAVDVELELRSIHLGVLTGIPIDDARKRYPCSSASMDRWRAREIDLCDIRIDGMENPIDFFRRGLRYLMEYSSRDRPEIVIATTSIMILFHNIYDMKGPLPGEGYRSRDYMNAELIDLTFSEKQIAWLREQSERYDVI